jgi:hypothetical protein
MPLTHHDDVELVAGDDWTVDGLLLDVNGLPLDLTNATFEWTLIDPNGLPVVEVIGAADITTVPGNSGAVQIKVPKQFTTPLPSGRYHDAMRVNISISSTFWVGTILVDVDPFGLLPAWPDTMMDSFDLAGGAAHLDTPTLTVH